MVTGSIFSTPRDVAREPLTKTYSRYIRYIDLYAIFDKKSKLAMLVTEPPSRTVVADSF